MDSMTPLLLADGFTFARGDWQALTPAHRRQHRIAERDGWTCAYCGCALTCDCGPPGVPATVDHRTARVLGGLHELDNLVLACMPCNARKGTRPPAVMFA